MKTIEIFQQSILPSHIMEKINNVPSEMTKKIDHVANVINAIETEAKKIKCLEADLERQRAALEFVIDQAKSSMLEEMNKEGIVEMGGELIKFVVKNNPASLKIEDINAIPEVYKVDVVKRETLNAEIKKALNENIEVPGARLERGTRLDIVAKKG